MKETENLKLNIYEGTDSVRRIHFNDDNEKIDSGYKELLEQCEQLGIDIENIDVSEDLEVLAEELRKEIDKRVLKEDGKGLSTNDYTNEDKELVQNSPKTLNDLNVSDTWEVPAGTVVEGLQSYKADKTYVDKQDLKLQQDVESKYEELNDRVSQHTVDIGDKADKTYVDTQDNKILSKLTSVEEQAGMNKASISAEDDTGEVSTPHFKQVNASLRSSASGKRSQVNASWDSEARQGESQVNASNECIASVYNSQVNVSNNCISEHNNNQINCSIGIRSASRYTMIGGVGSPYNEPSTNDRKWEINSETGTIKASGSITGNSRFSDFAEYMESASGAIKVGTIVTMDKGQKIKIAQEGDFPVGIISATAGIILNAQGFEWKDRHFYDRYGRVIKIDQEVEDRDKIYELYDEYLENNDYVSLEEFTDTLEKIPTKMEKIPLERADYDHSIEYTPREEREEWNVVGMKGQIYVNIDETVKEGDFVQAGKNGLATKGNKFNKNWLVMEVTTPYNEEMGHGIARLII